jgi:hypothetical protein
MELLGYVLTAHRYSYPSPTRLTRRVRRTNGDTLNLFSTKFKKSQGFHLGITTEDGTTHTMKPRQQKIDPCIQMMMIFLF